MIGMEAFFKYQQEVRHQATEHRLTDIPSDAFQQIVHLTTQYKSQELHTWIDIVARMYAHGGWEAMLKWLTPLPELQAPPHHSPHAVSDNIVRSQGQPDVHVQATPTTSKDEFRCACPSCWRHFARASDMIRHFKTTCKKMVTWKCPICAKGFSRQDHFREHHDKDHTCVTCRHDEQAQKLNTEFAALACGFCEDRNLVSITQLKDVDDYLEHVVDHFRSNSNGADWSVIRQIRSLLSQDHISTVWYGLGYDRFGPLVDGVPPWWRMTWTTDSRGVKDAIFALERHTPVDKLEQCLDGLLETGTLPQQPTMVLPRSSNIPWLPLSVIGPAIAASFSTPMRTAFGIPAAPAGRVLQAEAIKHYKTIEPPEAEYRCDSDVTTLVSSSGTSEPRTGAFAVPGMLSRLQSCQSAWTTNVRGEVRSSCQPSLGFVFDVDDHGWNVDGAERDGSSSHLPSSWQVHDHGKLSVQMQDPGQCLSSQGGRLRCLGISDDAFRISAELFSHQGEGM